MAYNVTTIADVRRANFAAGYYFFSRATMKFFGSSVVSILYKNRCFVTRELGYDLTRYYYTVRRFDPQTAQIDTVGEFQGYDSLTAAREAAKGVK